jgi:hypothetical protein
VCACVNVCVCVCVCVCVWGFWVQTKHVIPYRENLRELAVAMLFTYFRENRNQHKIPCRCRGLDTDDDFQNNRVQILKKQAPVVS